jgi:hypothetical protein
LIHLHTLIHQPQNLESFLHCAAVLGFGAGPGQAGGLASASTTVLAFFLDLKKNTNIIMTSLYLLRYGYLHFQTSLGTGCFSLTFPWTGWFRNYRF